MDQDALLEAYIKRLLDVQHGMAGNAPLSDAELKRIAMESGLPESQWEAWLERAEVHYQRGRTYNEDHNWEDARSELKQAVALYPNHAEANYELALACLRIAARDEDAAAEREFEVYVAQCLALEPLHAGAMALKTEENRLDAQEAAAAKSGKRKWMIVAGAAIACLLAIHVSISSGESSAREGVNSAWAQVENVYERRAALIPSLTATVEAAAGFERSTLLALQEQAQVPKAENSSPSDLESYAQSQQKLGETLSKTVAQAAQLPNLQSMEAFMDLQVQIEGAENRISIERRNYNKAVELYNRKISGFPYSFYGFEPMPYYHQTH